MKPIAKTSRVLALVVALGLTACGQRDTAPLSAFDGRVEDWTREILQDSPQLASHGGVDPNIAGGAYNNRLDDLSIDALLTRRTAAIRRLAELRAIDQAALDEEDQLTYAVLEASFSAAAASAAHEYGDFSSFGGISPYVLNPLDAAFATLPDFLERRHPVSSIADANAYLARLRGVAEAIDQETDRARADARAGVVPPYYIIDATLSALEGAMGQSAAARSYVTSFREKMDALVARETEPAARERLQTRALTFVGEAEGIVREQIAPAEQRQAAFLRSIRANATDNPSVSRLPNGEAFYRDALRIETTSDLTPDQIHRIGLDRVRALTAELDVALRRFGMTEGPVGTRLSAMTADPRYQYPDSDEGRAQLLADIETRVARVMEMAPRWFGALPTAKLEVVRVPVLAEASAPGASYSGPSFDGSSPGVYYVNLRNLGEMTRIDVPTQDFHEAVPGHHFQVALAQEQTDLPLLRRLISFNAFAEGWGLYAEEFADEQGLHDGDPVGRIGFLRWQLWRAARLVVDTGLHAKGWSRQQANDYLISVTGDAPGIIATEVDRYIVWPGQACGYEIGRREIMRLREEARSALGPDFDLKGFHDTVLLNGDLPLPVLETLVRAWIPQQQENAARERRRAG